MRVKPTSRFVTPSYRLYLDEVGNPDMNVGATSPERYLSLTGVIVGLEHVKTSLHPQLEALKLRHIPAHHPDDPVVLHRREILQKTGPFRHLREMELCRAFDMDLLLLLSSADYTVITVVIDKFLHRQRYGAGAGQPYHYSMVVLMERYALWLSQRNAYGDVLAEARGRPADEQLRVTFRNLLDSGDEFVNASVFKRISSRELKIRPKKDNIAGLQVADMIAYPSFRSMLDERLSRRMLGGFSATVCAILADKYRKDAYGRVDGFGRKWLP